MLDVPHFIAPMMIRFGNATDFRLLPLRQDLRAWHLVALADDRSDAVGWQVLPNLMVMKTDE
jgi:hypothetical protein